MKYCCFAWALISTAMLALPAAGIAQSESGERAGGASQTPGRAATSSTPDLVTVRGCLHGLVMSTVDDTQTNAVAPRQFKLTGDRRVLDALKKHSGHLEEITGTLKSGSGSGGTHIGERRVGKGRIYGGAADAPFQQPGVVEPAEVASTLQIQTVTHVADRCS